ncbi:MAG: excisionase [Clostridiales bacterium 43-6]|nr:MAG: excisionase [Clostridiales bacterium 43-6]
MEHEIVYSAQEVADILKIKKITVYNLINRGELVAYKVGNKMRVSNLELENYKRRSLMGASGETAKRHEAVSEKLYQPVPVMDESIPRETGFIICGQDAALDTLANYMQTKPGSTPVLRSYVGSYNGLYMLYQGQVSIATAHLWDSKSGLYNIPYVVHMLPGTPAVIVHLFNRKQGFYVQKGNPKNITSWDDLRRPAITIVNRERGSGTRVLLDEHLRIAGIEASSIQGYSRECFSHLTVAGTVARGGADIGFGTVASSKTVANVTFVPMQDESYDLIIKKEDFNKPLFQSVLNVIRSENFKAELNASGNYDISDIGKIIAET